MSPLETAFKTSSASKSAMSTIPLHLKIILMKTFIIKFSCLLFANLLFHSTVFAQFDIFGNIQREDGSPVDQVTIDLSGHNTLNQITGSAGTYNFLAQDATFDYTITPTKNLDWMECLSVSDIVLIGDHILNINLLQSPYDIIAADLNNSQTVTTFDLVVLKNTLLGNSLPTSKNSWTFVDGSQVLPQDPFSSPVSEITNIINLSANTQADFVAIKTGDVNACATISGTASTVFSLVGGVSACLGDVITFDQVVTDFTDVSGFQYTIQYDPTILSFNNVDDFSTSLPGLNGASFNTSIPGEIRCLWSNFNAATLPDLSSLYKLSFTVINEDPTPTNITFATGSLPPEIIFQDRSIQSPQLVNTVMNTFCGSGPSNSPLCNAPSTSYIAFNPDFAAMTTNGVFDVDVYSSNFNNVTGLQFTISWDPTQLQFNGTSGYNLSTLNSSSFNETDASSGILTFAWVESSLQGITLLNGSSLFQINFTLIGSDPTFELSITDSPTDFVAYDANVDPINFVQCGASVFVPPCGFVNIGLNNNGNSQDVYAAEDEIDSVSTITDEEIVSYVAEDEITLGPGFEVELGSDFNAVIAPCDDPGQW